MNTSRPIAGRLFCRDARRKKKSQNARRIAACRVPAAGRQFLNRKNILLRDARRKEGPQNARRAQAAPHICGDRQAGGTSARLIETGPRKSPYFFIHLQENYKATHTQWVSFRSHSSIS